MNGSHEAKQQSKSGVAVEMESEHNVVRWWMVNAFHRVIFTGLGSCILGFFTCFVFYVHYGMELNSSKTKEMLIGRIDSTSIPLLSAPAGPIQRISNFKLLGLHLDASLSCRHTSIPLYPQQANDCTFLSNWGEQASPHSNYYRSMLKQWSGDAVAWRPSVCDVGSWSHT